MESGISISARAPFRVRLRSMLRQPAGVGAAFVQMSQTQNSADPATRHDHHRGLRAVAIFEAAKGVVMLIAAFGFAEVLLRHVDLEDVTETVLEYIHVDPDQRIPHKLVEIAGRMMDADLFTVLAVAFAYSSLRFIEAYGLWRSRVWAEWLAIISGAIYLPFEIYKVTRRPTPAHWTILLVNIGVVAYIVWVRWDDIRERGRRPAAVGLAREGD
jgi:uncharacterized membrane protein (DUF2068 family)